MVVITYNISTACLTALLAPIVVGVQWNFAAVLSKATLRFQYRGNLTCICQKQVCQDLLVINAL